MKDSKGINKLLPINKAVCSFWIQEVNTIPDLETLVKVYREYNLNLGKNNIEIELTPKKNHIECTISYNSYAKIENPREYTDNIRKILTHYLKNSVNL